ncbi:MAG: phosphoribosylformimino-5-aminoimidazole carboxamide ribotide isomerase [Desulfamplus sp.]|nr:phosphoribosylformimino-5-aminoimidazole carboxamide ribotide isomerase [Desulfamplus sp.]
MKFRPCIDIKNGKVVQIVGGSLRDTANTLEGNGDASYSKDSVDRMSATPTITTDIVDTTITNFESTQDASYFATLYKNDGIYGGHVISLGSGNHEAVLSALRTFPGGLQFGGGITPDNAAIYLDAGASHVIVTSFVFSDGQINMEKLNLLVNQIGKKRLVLDLSCRKKDGQFWIVTDRWQNFTNVSVTQETLEKFAIYCDEFLVHGVDVEGKMGGVQSDLVELLGKLSPIPVTYAGGVKSFSDLDHVKTIGSDRVDLTIGSALDIFGGTISYKNVVQWHNLNL